MQRKLNFIGGADVNGVSGGYLYNLHLLKMLAAKKYTVVRIDPRQSLVTLDTNIPTIVDSLVVLDLCEQLNQFCKKPILLFHLPPELNSRLSHKPKPANLCLNSLIARSQIVTTGQVSYEYMQHQYELRQNSLHLIEPGLIKSWRSKKYYRSLPRRLISVASLIPGKGYELLLPLLAECLDLDWHLTFYGAKSFDPEYARKIMGKIDELGLSEKVEYGGTLSQIKLNMAMIESDLLIQCSPFETYSMITSEAIGAGLPVLSTKTGNHQVFSRSGLVSYVPEGTLAEFVEQLRVLLVSTSKYAEMRPQNLSHNRSWLEVANDFEEILER